MPTVPGSPSVGPWSSLTWAQAAARVAEVVGGQNTDIVKDTAKHCIEDAIQTWNLHLWKFLQIIADDITTSAGAATYSLPSNFRAPYSAELISANRPLKYVDYRQWSRENSIARNSGQAWFYTCYNTPTSGKVELLDTGIADTLRIRYYRPITATGNDNDVLDVPARYQTAILDAARARILALKGPTEKLGYWDGIARSGYIAAIADDNTQPDFEGGFEPGYANQQPTSDLHIGDDDY